MTKLGDMPEASLDLEWAGFRKWKPGRIHIFCPTCKRRMSNAERTEFDPPSAVLVHVWCEKCSQGCKTDLGYYFDRDGNVVREEYE